MNTALYLLSALVAIAAIYFVLTPLVRLYQKFRGTRVILCPENAKPAAVQVDAMRAALSAFGDRDLHLNRCSRWPEKQDCGQECLRQVETAPEDCLLRTMLIRWYAEKNCAICGKALGVVDWLDHKPALMGPDRKTVEWNQVPPETIPEVLTTHLPVCWDCHIADTFRRQYPDLVVDRPWHRETAK
jgi:hypothetical protein